MKAAWLVLALYSTANFGFELKEAHLYYAGALFSWLKSARTSHDYRKSEWELGAFLCVALGIAKHIGSKKSFSVSTVSSVPVPNILRMGITAAALLTSRSNAPLPYVIASLIALYEFTRERGASGKNAWGTMFKNDAQWWAGLLMMATHSVVGPSLADALYITQRGANGALWTVGAYAIADAIVPTDWMYS